MNTDHRYADIRDGVRALCAEFPDEYHRKVDTERAYPAAFVEALTKAGFGPGDEKNAHTIQEHVPVQEVVDSTLFYALFPHFVANIK